MLERAQAQSMAEDWCTAWNRRDLDAVMRHYADEVELNSPRVIERLGNASGWVKGKEALRAYFAIGMQAPNLRFELNTVLTGVAAMSVVYRRESGMLVCDSMELDAHWRARRVVVCYGANTA